MADRSVSVFLRANVSGYVASIEKAKLSTSDFARSASRDAAKNKADWDKVGKGMLVVGGAIALGLGAAVKASMEFRAQMAQVQSLSGASAADMKKLADAALTVGQKYGLTAKQVADAETELVKAGLSVKDILGGALTGALTLAADGQMNVADATQVAVSAMTQFKLTGADVPHIADLLAAGADKALGSVGDLGEALGSSGTVAHQFGWTLEETVGTLSEFAQNAQIGEKGGTLLRQMLLQLVNASPQATALMQKYGFSIVGANGAMVDSAQLAGRLQKSFGGLTPAVRNHALAVIFGAHAIQGANILMNDGAKVNAGWVTSVNDSGFAAKQAAGKMDSLAGDLSKLKASFETGLIKTGDEATGTLRGLVGGLTDVTQWYDHLSDSSRSMVTELALIVGGLTLVGGTALVMLPKIVAFRDALVTLGITGKGTAGALDATAAGETAVGGAAGGGGIIAGLRGKGALAAGGAGIVGAGIGLSLTSDKLPGPVNRAMKNYGAEHPGSTSKDFNNFVSSAATDKGAASQLKAYESESYKVKSAADAAAAGSKNAAGGMQKVTNSSHAAAMSVDDYTNALKAANQPALDARSAARDYQAALDAATASLKTNGHNLDIGTAKGRANQAALDGIASSALAAASANRAHGVSQAKTNSQIDAARVSLEKMAVKFGMSKKAAKEYIDKVLTIPASALTGVGLTGVGAVKAQAAALKKWLKGELSVINIQASAHVNDPSKKGSGAQATGGPIWGAGTATSDSIPAWLSNGEYVINAASAQRIGYSQLDQLNRYARGGGVGMTRRHFATGGMAGDPDSSLIQQILSQSYASGSDVSTARTRQAHATATLLAAEAALQKLRHNRHSTDAQIHAAEARETADRRGLTAATAALKSTEASYTAGRKPLADRYATAAASAARTDSTFLANLKKIQTRGYGPLAAELYAEGDDNAKTVAAQMVTWSNAKLFGVQKSLQTSAAAVAGLSALFNPAATAGPDMGQGPIVVQVQNPWTGEYLMAKVDTRVDKGLKTTGRQVASGQGTR